MARKHEGERILGAMWLLSFGVFYGSREDMATQGELKLG